MGPVRLVGYLRNPAGKDRSYILTKRSLLGKQRPHSGTIYLCATIRLCEIPAPPPIRSGRDGTDCLATVSVVPRAHFEVSKHLDHPFLLMWEACMQGHKRTWPRHKSTRYNPRLDSYSDSQPLLAVATQLWSQDGGEVRAESNILHDSTNMSLIPTTLQCSLRFHH